MKKLALLLLPISHLLYAQTDCRSLRGCAEQACRINNQLQVARQSNNLVQAARGENALKEHEANCKDDPNEALQQQIKEQKVKISGIESDLAKAHMRGDKYSATMMEKKLNDAKADLQKLIDKK